ncbi:MAG: hypothetical protein RLZ83_1519 [Pseudomonadota bacterium]|jgi:uncharacterized protein (DUF302 family)
MNKVAAALSAGLLLGAGLILPSTLPAAEPELVDPSSLQMMIEVPSPLGFEETLVKLEENAKAEGWKVPQKWKVNFQDNLLRVTDIDIGPNQVLKMCEPFAAAKLLVKDEYKQLTAMMPCTIAVYVKSDGKTYISMMNLDLMGLMFGGDVAEMAKELQPQMEKMLKLE